jgi:flavodoxin I
MKGRAGQKVAAFITHLAPAYPDQEMDAFTKLIQTACQENEMEYVGSFDCYGYLNDTLHKPVQEAQKLTDERWAGVVEQMTGKPNEEDVAKAKVWVQNLF